jgi:PPP family 3-phenylpropionic acid transporter
VLAVVYLLTFANSGIHLPLTSIAMENVGLSPSSIGAMWGARSLLSALAPVFFGVIADRLGSARPLLAGALATGCALLLWLSTTTTTWVCVLIFGLYGALSGPAGSLLDGMTLTALGDARERFGRWRAVGTLGFGAASFAVTLLLEEQLLEPTPGSLFPVCAALAGLGAVVVVAFVPRLPRPALQDPRLMLVVFRQPLLVGLVVLGLVLWCSHAAWASFLAILVERQGLAPRTVGAAVGFSVLIEMVTMASSTWLVRRFGAPRILVACAVFSCIRWTLSATALSATAFVLVHGLHGVSFGLFFITLVGLVAERAPPELRQASQGVISSVCFGLGGFLGSALSGALLERTQSASLVWSAMAVIAGLALVLAIVLARQLQRALPSPDRGKQLG